MIIDNKRIIFIHIPKCAGSSVEELFGVKPFPLHTPNYKNLTGWDNKNKIFLQHTSIDNIINHNLIEKEKVSDYLKFTIVRNPWDRALSSYLSLINDTKINDSFENFIYRKGKYRNVLTKKENIYYRGDYANTQSYYLDNNNNIEMDYIIRFEELSTINEVLKKIGLDKSFPHTNQTPNKKNYKLFYRENPNFIGMVEEVYGVDIAKFNYKLEI